MGRRTSVATAVALLIVTAACNDDPDPDDDTSRGAVTTDGPSLATGPTPPADPGSPSGSVAAPIVDPVIEVVGEGLADLVPYDGEPDHETRRAGGPTRPEGVDEPWDVRFELALPDSWSRFDNAVICGWTASRAWADQCIGIQAFTHGTPWFFGASTVGDDWFEIWLDASGFQRRLIGLDPSALAPGTYTVSFADPATTIDDVFTQPPPEPGNYLELG